METVMHSVMKGIFSTITSDKKYSPEFINEVDSHISKINGEAFVLLTVYDNIAGAYVIQGKGPTFKEAVDSALHTFYRKSKKLRFKLSSMKLDIVIDVYPLNSSKYRDGMNPNETALVLYNEGFAWGNSLEILFLPEEVSTMSLINNQQIDPKRIIRALNKHWISKRDERILDYSGLDVSFPVFRIKTISFYSDEASMIRLYNGHRLFPTIDTQLLLDSLSLVKDNYLKKVLDSNGRYIYSYQPQAGAKDGSYNIYHHAGMTYAILEAHQLFPEDGLLQPAEAAIRYLADSISQYEADGRNSDSLSETDHVKLNANTLAIIALAKYTEVTGNQGFIPAMQQLAQWITGVQDDTGRFSSEAILAMVRLYHIDGDAKWMDAAEKAAYYIIKVRDLNADENSIIHDHWLLYALNELYREAPKQAYLRHGMLISKAIIKSQILNDVRDIDWRGAYRIPYPRLESTPTACRSEGLCAAYALLLYAGKEKEAAILKTSIEEGIRFQLQNQIRPESAIYYKDSSLCLGAFRRGLSQYELRIDYTQHNISSIIAYYKILSGCCPR